MRLAVALRVCAGLGAILIVVLTIAASLLETAMPGTPVTTDLGSDLPPPWSVIVALIGSGLIAWALIELRRMLGHVISSAVLFSRDATRHFKRFALLLLAAAIASAVLPGALKLLLALAEGGGAVRLSFDSGDLLSIFLGIVFFFIAMLFDEAAEYEGDSRSIV